LTALVREDHEEIGFSVPPRNSWPTAAAASGVTPCGLAVTRRINYVAPSEIHVAFIGVAARLPRHAPFLSATRVKRTASCDPNKIVLQPSAMGYSTKSPIRHNFLRKPRLVLAQSRHSSHSPTLHAKRPLAFSGREPCQKLSTLLRPVSASVPASITLRAYSDFRDLLENQRFDACCGLPRQSCTPRYPPPR